MAATTLKEKIRELKALAGNDPTLLYQSKIILNSALQCFQIVTDGVASDCKPFPEFCQKVIEGIDDQGVLELGYFYLRQIDGFGTIVLIRPFDKPRAAKMEAEFMSSLRQELCAIIISHELHVEHLVDDMIYLTRQLFDVAKKESHKVAAVMNFNDRLRRELNVVAALLSESEDPAPCPEEGLLPAEE